MVETDIEIIKKHCQEKDDENWEFRGFLKSCNLGVNELDSIVNRIYQEVSSEIDCTVCANCCKEANFMIEGKDVKRLAQQLNLPLEEFKEKYTDNCKDSPGDKHTFNRLPCPLLENDRCKVYSFRPDNCRSFPYLHKKDFVFKLINVIENCSICPIVFNVYERLKTEIHLYLPEEELSFHKN